MKLLLGYILGVCTVFFMGYHSDTIIETLDSLFPEPVDGESES